MQPSTYSYELKIWYTSYACLGFHLRQLCFWGTFFSSKLVLYELTDKDL